MYDFVCEHLVPGCTHKDQDQNQADLYERAAKHIREHHDLGHEGDAIGRALEKSGAVFLRPA